MLQIKDHLEIISNGSLTQHDEMTITLLYLPVIKEQAYILYKLFFSLNESNAKFDNHLIISKLSGMSIETIENSRKTLEKFGLIKTYFNKSENKYLIVLFPPKEGRKFLKHDVYGRVYLNEMGEDVLKFQNNIFNKQIIKKSDYLDITCPMTNILQDNWTDDYESLYAKIKNEINASDKEKEINFNYDIFLDGYDIIWPKTKRTKKQLNQIGEIATLYGISEKAMRRLVNRSLNPKNYVLDFEKLTGLAISSKAKYEPNTDNVYKWPPRRFLEHKQNGTPISKMDLDIIEMLLNDYRFNSEVCNVLLDYILERSNQKLIKKFVENVAASWSRAKIDTYDKAVKWVEDDKGIIKAESAWKSDKNMKKDANVVNEKKLSEEERQQIISRIRNGGVDK